MPPTSRYRFSRIETAETPGTTGIKKKAREGGRSVYWWLFNLLLQLFTTTRGGGAAFQVTQIHPG